jgi:hypothetical protein
LESLELAGSQTIQKTEKNKKTEETKKTEKTEKTEKNKIEKTQEIVDMAPQKKEPNKEKTHASVASSDI